MFVIYNLSTICIDVCAYNRDTPTFIIHMHLQRNSSNPSQKVLLYHIFYLFQKFQPGICKNRQGRVDMAQSVKSLQPYCSLLTMQG